MLRFPIAPNQSRSVHLTFRQGVGLGLLVGLGFLCWATPASAHHPFGGQTPDSFLAGLLSGMGHPVIGWVLP